MTFGGGCGVVPGDRGGNLGRVLDLGFSVEQFDDSLGRGGGGLEVDQQSRQVLNRKRYLDCTTEEHDQIAQRHSRADDPHPPHPQGDPDREGPDGRGER